MIEIYWIYILIWGLLASLSYCLHAHTFGMLLHLSRSLFLSFDRTNFLAPGSGTAPGLTWIASFIIECGSQHNTLKQCLLSNPKYAFCPEDYLMLCCRSQEWMGRAAEERDARLRVSKVNKRKCWQGYRTIRTLSGRNRIKKTIWENNLAIRLFMVALYIMGKRKNPSVYQQCNDQINFDMFIELVIMH